MKKMLLLSLGTIIVSQSSVVSMDFPEEMEMSADKEIEDWGRETSRNLQAAALFFIQPTTIKAFKKYTPSIFVRPGCVRIICYDTEYQLPIEIHSAPIKDMLEYAVIPRTLHLSEIVKNKLPSKKTWEDILIPALSSDEPVQPPLDKASLDDLIELVMITDYLEIVSLLDHATKETINCIQKHIQSFGKNTIFFDVCTKLTPSILEKIISQLTECFFVESKLNFKQALFVAYLRDNIFIKPQNKLKLLLSRNPIKKFIQEAQSKELKIIYDTFTKEDKKILRALLSSSRF